MFKLWHCQEGLETAGAVLSHFQPQTPKPGEIPHLAFQLCHKKGSPSILSWMTCKGESDQTWTMVTKSGLCFPYQRSHWEEGCNWEKQSQPTVQALTKLSTTAVLDIQEEGLVLTSGLSNQWQRRESKDVWGMNQHVASSIFSIKYSPEIMGWIRMSLLRHLIHALQWPQTVARYAFHIASIIPPHLSTSQCQFDYLWSCFYLNIWFTKSKIRKVSGLSNIQK